jgi:hypothetical protein
MAKESVKIPRTHYLDDYSDEQAVRFEGKRQWLGYHTAVNLETIENSDLIDYVVKTGLQKPRKMIIPQNIMEKYCIDGLFFKIYEEQWGKPPGMCSCVSSQRLSEELLYSESYTEIMTEVRQRNLLTRVRDLKKKRASDWKKGIGFSISFADDVSTPEQEFLRERLKAIREAEEYMRNHPSHIIIGNSIKA